ncbi:MAG: hypothetical protein ACREA0_27285, partial [bacterium]
MVAGYPDGLEEDEESFAMASDLGLSHEQIRAGVNIGWSAIYFRDLPTAELWVARAHEMASSREMLAFEAYTTAEMALIDELRGDWTDAETKARFVLDNLSELGPANVVASTLLGRLQARRGEPEAKANLFRGWEQAVLTDEAQRLGPSGAALAEYVWVGGSVDQAIFPRLREVLAACLTRESPWLAGELAFYLHLIGQVDRIPDSVAEPYRLAGGGEWEKAASFWEQREIPYDRAVMLSFGSTDAKIEALSIFDDLAAAP